MVIEPLACRERINLTTLCASFYDLLALKCHVLLVIWPIKTTNLGPVNIMFLVFSRHDDNIILRTFIFISIPSRIVFLSYFRCNPDDFAVFLCFARSTSSKIENILYLLLWCHFLLQLYPTTDWIIKDWIELLALYLTDEDVTDWATNSSDDVRKRTTCSARR